MAGSIQHTCLSLHATMQHSPLRMHPKLRQRLHDAHHGSLLSFALDQEGAPHRRGRATGASALVKLPEGASLSERQSVSLPAILHYIPIQAWPAARHNPAGPLKQTPPQAPGLAWRMIQSNHARLFIPYSLRTHGSSHQEFSTLQNVSETNTEPSKMPNRPRTLSGPKLKAR